MYVPVSFQVADLHTVDTFLQAHSFATLVTMGTSVPTASHLPFLVKAGDRPVRLLVSHMAKANPQWQQFLDEREVLVIFAGPHAYISPSWYATHPAVPTWNYAAVHVYGVPRILRDHDQIAGALADMLQFHEDAYEDSEPRPLPTEYRDRLMAGIVAFEISVTRIEASFKLSQNRSTADIVGVHARLTEQASPAARALAELMAQHLPPCRSSSQSNAE